MKPLLFLFSFLLAANILWGQRKAGAIKADINGILYFTKFQQQPLVPVKRQNKYGTLTEVMANGYYEFTAGNARLAYRVGLGYSRKELGMNKYSVGDILFSFLPFVATRPDTFRLQRVVFKNDYLNLPLAAMWRLSKNPEARVQAQLGLQANVGFLLQKDVVLEFDATTAPATVTEIGAIRQNYLQGPAKVVVGLLPRLDLNGRIYKNLGIFYTVQFYTLQLNAFHPRIARGGVGLGGAAGLFLNL